MNVGYKESRRLGSFDCYIFHDVDLLPEDDRNFYTCSYWPRHVAVFLKRWDYKFVF